LLETVSVTHITDGTTFRQEGQISKQCLMIKMNSHKVITVHSFTHCSTLLFHLQAGSVAQAPC